jgi:OmpA-OmpF porin, OOP family
MAVKIKTSGKVAGILILLGGLFAAKTMWWDKRPKEAKISTEIGKVVLPDIPEASLQGNAANKIGLPTETPSANGGTKIKWEVMAWNAQFPLMFANGGALTTKGSLINQLLIS